MSPTRTLLRAALAACAALLFSGLAAAPASAQSAWTFKTLGQGIKPAIAVDANGTPHVAWLTELMRGSVFHATNAGGAWRTETVATGYFYGPVDIDVGTDGTAYIAYHDHEDRRFRPDLGSGVVLAGRAGTWKRIRIDDPGHDQWDADIAAGEGGVWHFAGIDPAQFGSSDGVEYITNAYGEIRVEQIGSGAQPYEFGVSIERSSDGRIGIAYFDAADTALVYAERAPGAGGAWTLTEVDSQGDAGRYASLAYGPDGQPHLSYFVAEGGGGTVRHAWRRADGTWQTEAVGTLGDVRPGMIGARKITSIAFAPDGTPRVMFTDRRRVLYASRAGGGWQTSTVFENAQGRLGQLIEFALDGSGTPHATFFVVTAKQPALMGDIIYATVE